MYIKKSTLIGLVIFSVIGLGAHVSYSEYKLEKDRKLEFNRLAPLLEQVEEKAIGKDNYFSSKEQAEFLRGIGYERMIVEGEEVDFGTMRFHDPRILPRFFVGIGNEKYWVPEETIRNYLRE